MEVIWGYCESLMGLLLRKFILLRLVIEKLYKYYVFFLLIDIKIECFFYYFIKIKILLDLIFFSIMYYI